MTGRMLASILSVYDGASFDRREKVKLLFHFNLFTILLFSIIIVLINGANIFALAAGVNYILAAFIAVPLLSMLLLRGGSYDAASVVSVTILSVGIMAILYNGFFTKGNLDFISNLNYVPAAIIFAAIFCRMGYMMGLGLFFIAAGTGIVYLVGGSQMDIAAQKFVRKAYFDYLFAVIFSLALCYLMIRINRRGYQVAREESDLNREQFLTLQDLFTSIREISSELASSSYNMAATAAAFAESTQSQAATAEEVSASIEEITSGIESVAASSLSQNESVSGLIEVFERLSRGIGDTGERIELAMRKAASISERAVAGTEMLSQMDESMRNIVASSRDMNGIVEIIRDIFDKINLLSLNAAIEAARAGDAGRGFAVVADEIAKLADQTGSSLKEIDALIKGNEGEIQSGLSRLDMVVGIINEILASLREINDGMNEANDFMKEQLRVNKDVDEKSRTVKKLAEEITMATGEQKSATDEIVRSVGLINEQAVSGAESAEKLAASIEELSRMASTMKSRIQE